MIIRALKIVIFSLLIIFLVSCNSTSKLSPGNPLPGIALAASGDTVLFSWTTDVPISRSLRPNTNIVILAQYDTKYGEVVNEVIANTRIRAGINGVKLKLADTLRLTPSGPVCLRIAVNKMPIPIRIATYEQSSNGFYYPEWSDNVKLASTKKSIKQSNANIEKNIQNFSKTDPQFIKWQAENNIYAPEQCNELNITTNSTRPSTAIQGEGKLDAAKEQCVALYQNFSWGEPANYLPSPEQLISASQNKANQLEAIEELKQDLSKFTNPKIYFPFSKFPIDFSLIYQVWGNQQKLSEGIAGLVIEAYQACKTEVSTRFDESYNDWLMVSNPQDIKARIEPLRRICRAKFVRDGERVSRLAEFQKEKIQSDMELDELNKQLHSRLPNQKALIPFACKAENL